MEKLFESVKEIVTSPNAWLFLLHLVVVLILVIKMSKNGLFNVKTKTIQIGAIGNSENERLILTKQNNLAYSYIQNQNLDKRTDYKTSPDPRIKQSIGGRK